MINIEPRDKGYLYLDKVTSFDRYREQDLVYNFTKKLDEASDKLNDKIKSLEKLKCPVKIIVEELDEEIRRFKISCIVTGYDNAPREDDHFVDDSNFIPCLIDMLDDIILEINFRMPITARDWKKKVNAKSKHIADIVYEIDRKNDVVNHPGHYETGKFECIEVMQEALGTDAVKDFCICNAFKYVYRHKRKNGLEDIKKAKWYIDKFLELSEEESNG